MDFSGILINVILDQRLFRQKTAISSEKLKLGAPNKLLPLPCNQRKKSVLGIRYKVKWAEIIMVGFMYTYSGNKNSHSITIPNAKVH